MALRVKGASIFSQVRSRFYDLIEGVGYSYRRAKSFKKRFVNEVLRKDVRKHVFAISKEPAHIRVLNINLVKPRNRYAMRTLEMSERAVAPGAHDIQYGSIIFEDVDVHLPFEQGVP